MPNGETLKHIENKELPYYYSRGGKIYVPNKTKYSSKLSYKMEYLLKLDCSNGYKCSCCRHEYKSKYNVSIQTVEDESFFDKKSCHSVNFDELVEIIYAKGCEEIVSCQEYGDEFLYTFTVEYTFHSEELETDVTHKFKSRTDFEKYNLYEKMKIRCFMDEIHQKNNIFF
jgi:hypothetical protein